jgi:cyclic nucleotide-binding protein
MAGSLVAGALIATTSVAATFAATALLFALAVAPAAAIRRDPVPEYRAAAAGAMLAPAVIAVFGARGDRRGRRLPAALRCGALARAASLRGARRRSRARVRRAPRAFDLRGILDVSDCEGSPPPFGAGDFFGEIALLRDVPRTATVTARRDARLYVLDREAFLSGVGPHRHSTDAAERVATTRLRRQ